jgi:hypothetical protein
MAAISPTAQRSTTAAISIVAEPDAGLTAVAAERPARVAEPKRVVLPVAGAELKTALEQRPGLSMETGRQPEDTPNRAARAAFAPVHSADMAMAGRRKVFRRADRAASAALTVAARAAAVDMLAAVAEAMADTVDLTQGMPRSQHVPRH